MCQFRFLRLRGIRVEILRIQYLSDEIFAVQVVLNPQQCGYASLVSKRRPVWGTSALAASLGVRDSPREF